MKEADIGDEKSAADLVCFAEDTLGGIDVLVNNAGLNIPTRSIADVSVADWTKVINVNLNGTFHMIHAALPQMRERQQGQSVVLTIVPSTLPYSCCWLAISCAR